MKKVLALVMAVATFFALAITTTAAEIPSDYIAYFSFDDVDNGLKGGIAVANSSTGNNADVVLDSEAHSGKALYMTGGTYFLNVTKEDGTPLLTDQTELTISFWSNTNGVGPNWTFYIAPNSDPQTYLSEKYLGCLENTSITIERYYLDGAASRTPSLSTPIDGNTWKMVTVTFTETSFTLYVDGEWCADYQLSTESLPQIFGENGVFQIGKANWTDAGEFFEGYIDEFYVYDYAMTDEQVLALYAAQGGEVEDTTAEDTTAEDTDAEDTTADTTKNEDTSSDATTTDADTKAEEKKGCGSVMTGAAAVIVALTTTFGVALVKKHDK
ncbi:MAG: LamG domain-containing protein [Clostridiales bacterium]|nr:LamG domain-containing protein [Clostridiales bacterium]